MKPRSNSDVALVLENVLTVVRVRAEKLQGGTTSDYNEGLIMAYAEVLKVAVEEAKQLGVPLSLLGLQEDFDPHKWLQDAALKAQPKTSSIQIEEVEDALA